MHVIKGYCWGTTLNIHACINKDYNLIFVVAENMSHQQWVYEKIHLRKDNALPCISPWILYKIMVKEISTEERPSKKQRQQKETDVQKYIPITGCFEVIKVLGCTPRRIVTEDLIEFLYTSNMSMIENMFIKQKYFSTKITKKDKKLNLRQRFSRLFKDFPPVLAKEEHLFDVAKYIQDNHLRYTIINLLSPCFHDKIVYKLMVFFRLDFLTRMHEKKRKEKWKFLWDIIDKHSFLLCFWNEAVFQLFEETIPSQGNSLLFQRDISDMYVSPSRFLVKDKKELAHIITTEEDSPWLYINGNPTLSIRKVLYSFEITNKTIPNRIPSVLQYAIPLYVEMITKNVHTGSTVTTFTKDEILEYTEAFDFLITNMILVPAYFVSIQEFLDICKKKEPKMFGLNLSFFELFKKKTHTWKEIIFADQSKVLFEFTLFSWEIKDYLYISTLPRLDTISIYSCPLYDEYFWVECNKVVQTISIHRKPIHEKTHGMKFSYLLVVPNDHILSGAKNTLQKHMPMLSYSNIFSFFPRRYNCGFFYKNNLFLDWEDVLCQSFIPNNEDAHLSTENLREIYTFLCKEKERFFLLDKVYHEAVQNQYIKYILLDRGHKAWNVLFHKIISCVTIINLCKSVLIESFSSFEQFVETAKKIVCLKYDIYLFGDMNEAGSHPLRSEWSQNFMSLFDTCKDSRITITHWAEGRKYYEFHKKTATRAYKSWIIYEEIENNDFSSLKIIDLTKTNNINDLLRIHPPENIPSTRKTEKKTDVFKNNMIMWLCSSDFKRRYLLETFKQTFVRRLPHQQTLTKDSTSNQLYCYDLVHDIDRDTINVITSITKVRHAKNKYLGINKKQLEHVMHTVYPYIYYVITLDNKQEVAMSNSKLQLAYVQCVDVYGHGKIHTICFWMCKNTTKWHVLNAIKWAKEEFILVLDKDVSYTSATKKLRASQRMVSCSTVFSCVMILDCNIS